MNKLILILIVITGTMQSQQSELQIDYLGQKPPGLIPELFAEGIISNNGFEYDVNFTPDGNELFFAVWDKKNDRDLIYRMVKKNKVWSKPILASFSGKYIDIEPSISQDGKKMFFASTRPINPNDTSGIMNIWYIEKNIKGWSNPILPGFPLTRGINQSKPMLALDGNLYFSSHNNPHGIAISKFCSGKFSEPKSFNEKINRHFASGAFMSRDGKYFLFHSNRKGGKGSFDIYICFLRNDNSWTNPINLDIINSEFSEGSPYISPDGKYLFFNSNRNDSDNMDVFWISTDIIEELKVRII